MRKSSAPKQSSSFLRLSLLMRPYIGKLLICMAAVLVVNMAELFKPFVAEIIIDHFLTGQEEQYGLYSITGMGILYFGVAVLGSVFSMTQVRLIARISQDILNDMRRNVFRRILHMNMKTLDQYGTGRLLTRATNDVETVNEFYSDVFLNLFKDIFLLLGIVVMMLIMDYRLALIAFTGIPVIAFLTIFMKRIIKANFRKMKKIIGHINGFIAENVSGVRIIQAFHREKAKLKEFRDLNAAYYKTTYTQVMMNSFLRPVMEVINSMVIALLIAYGYNRISGGLLEVGVLYAFTNYVKQFFDPINDLAEKFTTIEGALVSTDRIYEILEEPGVEDMTAGSYFGPVSGTVEFKDVWFAYQGENWILKGISFRIEKGQKAAFVGHTGVGKSTIINLISRYYTIQKGEILVDGVPVSEWNLEALRRGVSTVMQDVFLFTGDIADNLDMHASLSEEIMEESLATAAASTFVHENGGLHSPVTEQGLNYSTGQRQLLSFARAIAHDPAILVLDEATAHIDTNTEELIQRSIENISQGRTSIFIAHRLSTIRNCDTIFVLDKGQIAEQGTHDELLAQQGIYYDLVNAELQENALTERTAKTETAG